MIYLTTDSVFADACTSLGKLVYLIAEQESVDGSTVTIDGYLQMITRNPHILALDEWARSEIANELTSRGIEHISINQAVRDAGGDYDRLFAIARTPNYYEDADPHLVTRAMIIKALSESKEYLHIDGFPRFSDKVKLRIHDTIVLGGETGTGKSALAQNWIDALSKQYPVVYVNMEMSERDVFTRLLAMETDLPVDKISFYGSDAMDSEETERVDRAIESLTDRKPIKIYTEHRIETIEQIIKMESKDKELLLVFLDHVHLMTIDGMREEYQRFSAISGKLRELSLRYPIILFELVQLNRTSKTDHQKPYLGAVKNTGSLENDSTHVSFIWERWTGSGDNAQPTGDYQLIVRKNRGGAVDANQHIHLDYNKTTQRITETGEFTETDQPAPPMQDRFSVFDAWG